MAPTAMTRSGIEAELAGLGPRQLRPLVESLGEQGAVLVLCGDPPEGVVRCWSDGLEDATLDQPRRRPGRCPWQPPQQRLAALSSEQDTEQLVLMLGAATVPFGHPDALALRLLQAHLGMGMSSRLFVVMREERGLAYDVGAHLPARSRSGAVRAAPLHLRRAG